MDIFPMRCKTNVFIAGKQTPPEKGGVRNVSLFEAELQVA
ncbi:hypothetical protein GGE29_000316 [Agrobacterium tumefaciens]|jgi:hypothetical protein|uniref:Uncharacterized protein n=1 Tax=Agrobacterium tumefaciens TaxID=358 RepID=A0AAW8LUA6_AGRTU|nr:hypothetical protein [Agrobacterium radiobacter]MBP2532518.1 hypothetical protein [Agrobacterium tumefaciens]MBB4451866.1 hypothetical protein [Agrobacterium radiobacter]MBP2563766.1 hypothetical protein [Agrobacterium tumefaciens]MBP2569184.1 hypothetical protein [Agrobacterium tumefaciens]